MAYMFGPWKPDEPPHLTDGLVTASGIYASVNGYRPISGFSEIADALTGTFKGGAAFIDSNGGATIIAGDGTDLYKLAAGSWTSILDSLTVNSRWYFAQFGDDAVAVNGGAPVKVGLTAGTAGALGGSPPTADLVTVVRDFVVLGRSAGSQIEVYWSGFNNAESWTAGTNQSGFQKMLTGGKIMGLAGGEYGIILQRFRIVRMSYTADATVPFQFDEISSEWGCVAEGSVAQVGKRVYFLSDRGFAYCDGSSEPVAIGAEVFDRTFQGEYPENDLANMWATVDPKRSLVIWCMPGKLWLYNWALNRMTTATLPVNGVLYTYSEGTTLEQLDALYGNLDSIPYSLDDPRFASGSPRVTVVHFDGRFGVLAGDALEAEIETPFIALADTRQTRVRFVNPVTDATDGISLTIDARVRLGDDANETVYDTLRDSGEIPVRKTGRFIKVKQAIAAGTDWTFTQGLDFKVEAGGAR